MNNKIKIFIIAAFCVLFSIVFLLFFYAKNDTRQVSNTITANKTVIIDPGHGGVDAGATANNVLEKNINLDISLKLKQFLQAFGFNVIMTRDTDTEVISDADTKYKKRTDLQNRVDVFNCSNNNIVISIHQNMFSQKKYNGTQTFYSKNNPDSEILANCIQNSVKNLLQKDNERQCKQAGKEIYILDKTDSVCVLVECGFLSNHNELHNLQNKNYQSKIAYSICLGFLEFYNTNNK